MFVSLTELTSFDFQLQLSITDVGHFVLICGDYILVVVVVFPCDCVTWDAVKHPLDLSMDTGKCSGDLRQGSYDAASRLPRFGELQD